MPCIEGRGEEHCFHETGCAHLVYMPDARQWDDQCCFCGIKQHRSQALAPRVIPQGHGQHFPNPPRLGQPSSDC